VDSPGIARSLTLLLTMSSSHLAFAQALSPGQDQPPPGTAMASLVQLQRWFELDAPFSRPLKISFDTRPVPTFETLLLPTFEGRGQLWQRGNLDVSLFERVVPALELDCRRTCRPILEQSLGLDARLSFGGIGRQIPDTFLFARGEAVRLPKGFSTRALVGLGGLLDL
jgi:hypothetical protein